MAVYLDDF